MQGILKFLIFTISGSSFIIWISKSIGSNAFLEYFGRNSLIVYLTHFCIIRYLYYYTKPILELGDSRIYGCIYSLFVAILTYTLCYYTIKLFVKRPFNILTGKF